MPYLTIRLRVVLPRLDGPVLRQGEGVRRLPDWCPFIVSHTELMIWAKKQRTNAVASISVCLQLLVLTRVFFCLDHLKKPSAVGPIVIDHIQTVFFWLVCIRQAIPRFGVKVAGGRLVAPPHSDVESHGWR